MDALRQQMSQCWNVPIGAYDAANLVVEVRVFVGPDRRVRRLELVDPERSTNAFWRTASESALRAFAHPTCQVLALPPEKYDIWKAFILTFNPAEMF